MNLEIFRHIDEVVETFDKKRDIYKLIAEDIQNYFEENVFTQSQYTLSMMYRLKSSESIREKLIRNSYISRYDSTEEIISNFQDLIGFRIECKFIDDEKYVYELLRSIFVETEDGIYFYDPIMPKIRLDLSQTQPQRQQNGFSIYKLDGLFLLGKEKVRFELQIKSMVNAFWGEVEHKIIYKNNSYHVVDNFVSDLMQSIKKSLNMIDGQLYVLYERFKRAEEEGVKNEAGDINSIQAMERFIAKMVCDTFAALLNSQVGFTVDFKSSCDAVVHYMIESRNAGNSMDAYARAMLDIFLKLNSIKDENVRVDKQIEFDRKFVCEDIFSRNIIETMERQVNKNYKWHLFVLMLMTMTDMGDNCTSIESYVRYYKQCILSNEAFHIISGESEKVVEDTLVAISEVIAEKRAVEYLTARGLHIINRAVSYVLPLIAEELERGGKWEDFCGGYLMMLKSRLNLK